MEPLSLSLIVAWAVVRAMTEAGWFGVHAVTDLPARRRHAMQVGYDSSGDAPDTKPFTWERVFRRRAEGRHLVATLWALGALAKNVLAIPGLPFKAARRLRAGWDAGWEEMERRFIDNQEWQEWWREWRRWWLERPAPFDDEQARAFRPAADRQPGQGPDLTVEFVPKPPPPAREHTPVLGPRERPGLAAAAPRSQPEERPAPSAPPAPSPPQVAGERVDRPSVAVSVIDKSTPAAIEGDPMSGDIAVRAAAAAAQASGAPATTGSAAPAPAALSHEHAKAIGQAIVARVASRLDDIARLQEGVVADMEWIGGQINDLEAAGIGGTLVGRWWDALLDGRLVVETTAALAGQVMDMHASARNAFGAQANAGDTMADAKAQAGQNNVAKNTDYY